MNHQILYQPSFAVAKISLQPGESVRAEPGAMMSMSPTVEVQSKMQGGLGKALGRMLGGESLFQSTYTATQGPGELLLAPASPGDIMPLQLQGNAWMITSGCFLACDSHLEFSTQMSGRSFFGGEGLFIMRVAGTGTVLVNTFGAIHALQLAPGQPYVVDTGHIVAFSEGMGYEVRKVTKSILGSLTSGEGFVVVLTGPGVVYLQTRTPQGFAGWLSGMLPSR